MTREEIIAALKKKQRSIAPDQEVTVGPFIPEDGPGVSLAYLETYGDAFPVDHVYDPEEVIRRNQTDDQFTVVARTPKGEVVGLAGLFRHAPDPGVYEGGQLMVLKSYRNSRVGMELSSRLLGKESRRPGIDAVFVEAVCNHPASQRLALDAGLKLTGLEVECMPSLAYAREGGVTRNVSLLLAFRVTNREPCTVHLPRAYEGIIGERYKDLGLERDLGTPGSPSGTTLCSEFSIPNDGLLRLTISRIGGDFSGIIGESGAVARARGPVQLYLNLGDPAAPQAVSLLRDKGFFFGGLLPRWFGTDGLVMQKVPRAPDWNGLKLHGEEASKMRDYVRRDYEEVTFP